MTVLEAAIEKALKDLSYLQILGPRNDYKTNKAREIEIDLRAAIKKHNKEKEDANGRRKDGPNKS